MSVSQRPSSATPPILEVRGLVAGYEESLPIVRGIDLDVSPGEIVAVLGPNGAGKSTFVKAVAGVVPTFGGRVSLRGRDVTARPAHLRVSDGLAFVPQTENIFASLTILENLRLCAGILPAALRQPRIDAAFAMFPDLGSRPNLVAGALSGGQRQMLATARALIVDPAVLILDEPSAGLSPKLVHDVFETLERVRETGVAILLVEQNVRAALSIADRGVVLAEGRLRHAAPAAELRADPNLGALFLGSYDHAEATP
ncbi:ABC transporter ATP-binding protein [Antarcticirhabdus aurantiaca]|uniref:ABC transporter ATP-binding protein n=1 Tax=Antarcticirhabdus aurantiaca TaxID=2606717 RepID=A0ACD4NMX2_9HYPH|nr:ABC transporter ATP-binding protein [Antarcticirhabdus aurantiaca]WAJ28123.1 ABC transporter ATP-binding protein [Jeongeuplla avenae]